MKSKIVIGALVLGIVGSIGFNVVQYTQGNKIEAEASALQSEIAALEESVSSIQSEVSDKEKEKEDLEKTISDLQNSLETLQSENDNLNKELEENKVTLEAEAKQEVKSEEVVKSTEDNKQTSKDSANNTTNNSTIDNGELSALREQVKSVDANILATIKEAQTNGTIPADAVIKYGSTDVTNMSEIELKSFLFFTADGGSTTVATSADGLTQYDYSDGRIIVVTTTIISGEDF